MIYNSASSAWGEIERNKDRAAIYLGDCRNLLAEIPNCSIDLVVTSPPYCMGKEYETGSSIGDFSTAHEEVLPEIARVLKPEGSVCWQVGYHVYKSSMTPLDYLVFDSIRKTDTPLVLRNRVIWHFGHGQHCEQRFSGRHESILWFTKTDKYIFNLDAVRVPQKYPGKKASKGPRKGEFSGNPLGKNPSDVWDIPNVKANHIEKTAHPCQFPVALVRRLVLSLTNVNGIVLDPFSGSASSGVAALIEGRRFLGAELRNDYIRIAEARLREAINGSAKVRPDQEIMIPSASLSVARKPSHFWPREENSAT